MLDMFFDCVISIFTQIIRLSETKYYVPSRIDITHLFPDTLMLKLNT
jgi:hypothetical protein